MAEAALVDRAAELAAGLGEAVSQSDVHELARALFVSDASGIICFGDVYPDLLNPGVDDVLTVLESL